MEDGWTQRHSLATPNRRRQVVPIHYQEQQATRTPTANVGMETGQLDILGDGHMDINMASSMSSLGRAF